MVYLILSIATLAMGIIIGYLGQRSGFCSTGSIRNFLLTRNAHFLRDVAALTVTAFAGYLLLSAAGITHGFPAFASAGNVMAVYGACINPYASDGNVQNIVILTILGGFGVGLFSVMADGCPFRQHVRASEGDRGSVAFILGFYLAAIAFGFLI
ncbi:Sulphur transport [uncultured archaeon]|nr:Sulphur transport [uncultured archaeon]